MTKAKESGLRIRSGYSAIQDVAARWGTNPLAVLDLGVSGRLAICAVADAWEFEWCEEKKDRGAAVKHAPFRVTGPVPLLIDDLVRLRNEGEVYVLSIDDVGPFHFGTVVAAFKQKVHAHQLVVRDDDRDAYAKHNITATGVDDAKVQALLQLLAGNHPAHSKELEAAVSAWLSLCHSQKLQTNKGAKQQITEWLAKNRRGTTTTAAERIAQVVVPEGFKGGGAPKSERKRK